MLPGTYASNGSFHLKHASHSSTTSTAVHLICNGTVPGYLPSAVIIPLSRRHDVKTMVAVLCLPSSGSTASSSVYCRQLPSFWCQHATTRVFIPVSDFSFPGIGNGKLSFPGIPGMQGVTQWVVSALSFHCVDAVNALYAFVQPFR